MILAAWIAGVLFIMGLGAALDRWLIGDQGDDDWAPERDGLEALRDVWTGR